LGSGAFSLVFPGINETDGREVAIKRIEKLRLPRPEDKREITNLLDLTDCEQVVRYLSFFEDKYFCYVVLELMEGNLDEYFDGPFDNEKSMLLCQDAVQGLTFLHGQNIFHRDIKPSNILFKTHPKLCLKIADFGLSRRTDSTSTTVYGTNVGTRCWIAPEVLKSVEDHSKSSDIFACGLVIHYILSVKRHPFAPADCAGKGELQINNETESNVINDKMEGLDNSLCAEATDLIKTMLESDESKRPDADKALVHPFFWSKKKKMEVLTAVGNQPEFECPRSKRLSSVTAVETNLEASFSIIVKFATWDDKGNKHMPDIYTEMKKKRKYKTNSVVELVRLIRNAITHVSQDKRPPTIRKQLLEDFVFLDYFPNLVMEVFKAVINDGWDQTRDEIKYAINK
jgi:serine/threonine-protein kinase/endoribonuclease IRE1